MSQTRSSGLYSMLTSLISGVIVFRFILAEESRTSPSFFPSVPRPARLLKREKEYLDWVDDYIAVRRRSAKTRLSRYYVTMVTVTFSLLLAVPAGVLSWPPWVSVFSVLVSSAALAVHFILHDQKLGVIDLTVASDLQKLLRQFRYAIDQDGSADMRQRFERFRSTVEDIKKTEGERSLKIMGTEPQLPRRA